MDDSIRKIKVPIQKKMKKRFELAFRKKKIIVILSIFGLFSALIVSNFLPKYYRTSGKIFLKYNSVNNNYLDNSGNIVKEIALLESTEFIDTILDKLSKKGISITRTELLESKEILVDNSSSIIGLQIISDEAEKSADITNLCINEFYNISILNNQSYLINALKIILDRENALLESINQGLSSSDDDILSSLSLGQENLISQISEFESELESIELDNQIYSFELNRLKEVLHSSYPNLSEEIVFINSSKLTDLIEILERMQSITTLKQVSNKLGGIEIQYLWPEAYDIDSFSQVEKRFFNELRVYISDNYIGKVKNSEDFLYDLVKKYFEVEIKVNSIDLTKSTIFNNLTSLENQFNRIPFGRIEEARESRIRKFNNSLLIKIKTKKEILSQRKSKYFAEVDYITEAKIPDSYFQPSITMNTILGTLAGFIIGLILAFSKTSVKVELIESADDLDEYGFKLLSQIPKFSAGAPILFDSSKQDEKNKNNKLIIQAFSSIETFIKYGSLDKTLKSILFMSGQSGEGKSVIASNVAIALANSGNKVLLVDANLKFPVLYKFFKIKSTPSLAHYLFRKKELEEIIRKTYHKNLDIITCIEFPQNPAVIITSERMKNFIVTVHKDYDYVIYDSCSLNILEETIKITDLMDEVILVVRAGKTKLSELLSVQRLLEDNGLGDCEVILNGVTMNNSI
jgi:capsular exopolysaccharide synthesis family protein